MICCREVKRTRKLVRGDLLFRDRRVGSFLDYSICESMPSIFVRGPEARSNSLIHAQGNPQQF